MVINFNKARTAPLAAEFLGTGVLVMVALVLSQTTGVPYFIATSVAVTLALVYVLFGSVSGGHFNPAITVGMWAARKMATIRGISYIAAQLLGGVAAWQLFQYFSNQALPVKSSSWSTTAWLAEVVGTAILAVGLTAALTRRLDTLTTALTYGASFFAGIMVAATASAAYLNPASALALRNFNAVYILGPLVGGIIGVGLYTWFFAPVKGKK
ncbi:MAG TPA: aquaporin [Candidatus Saccharimonadales bacterium]|nr:aquaporin [Candidatus Saccharimonadales bacterium]